MGYLLFITMTAEKSINYAYGTVWFYRYIKNGISSAKTIFGQPTKIYTQRDAIYVIRHKKLSTYKMEL